ncbi:MAG TPA: Gfo/Idh/MocA family oxidoreductase [Gaiellaceae bacterium]
MVVGLVGCGRWGVHILRDLRALGCDVPVVARSEASVARARDGGASAVVTDVSGLRDVDGIVVATPTSSHAEVVEAALEHGVPVFVEKPLCADAARAARLSELGRDRLFVMDKWRYHPGVLELAAIARSGRLGHVHGLSTRRVGWGRQHDDVDSAWVLAPHDLSIALEILGRVPQPVCAVGLASGNDVLHLEATLDAGPAWHTLTVSFRTPGYGRSVELHCADGTATLAGGWDTHVTIIRAEAAETDGEQVETPGELPLLAELRMFVEHLGGGPPPKSSGREGAEVVAVIERLRSLVLSP